MTEELRTALASATIERDAAIAARDFLKAEREAQERQIAGLHGALMAVIQERDGLAVLLSEFCEAMETARQHCHTDLAGEAADVLEVALQLPAKPQAVGAALRRAARQVLDLDEALMRDAEERPIYGIYAPERRTLGETADALRAAGLDDIKG